jgi:hypothetical protein
MKIITAILISLMWFTGCGSVDSSSNKDGIEEQEVSRQDSILITGWYFIVTNDNGYKRKLEIDTGFYFIDPTPIVSAKHFTNLEVTENNWHDAMLVIKFDKKGTKAWSEATEKYIDKHMAFIIDDKLIVTPKVNSHIIPSKIGKVNIPYFICLVSGRRARILYKCYGSHYWKHRDAYQHRIYYQSQISSRLSLHNDRYWKLQNTLEHFSLKLRKSITKAKKLV